MLLSPQPFSIRSAIRPRNLPPSLSRLHRGYNKAPRGARDALDVPLPEALGRVEPERTLPGRQAEELLHRERVAEGRLVQHLRELERLPGRPPERVAHEPVDVDAVEGSQVDQRHPVPAL